MPERRRECASCGRVFGCGAGTGECWCSELDVGASGLAALRERFADCVCPDCLRRFAVHPGTYSPARNVGP